MEIRLSQYNEPFCEPPQEGVHYISLDNQRDMRRGCFESHVRVYLDLVKNSFLEFYFSNHLAFNYELNPFPDLADPLTSRRELDALSQSEDPTFDVEQFKFLEELFYQHGIKSAGKRIGRYD